MSQKICAQGKISRLIHDLACIAKIVVSKIQDRFGYIAQAETQA
jgi:hypothetical protein